MRYARDLLKEATLDPARSIAWELRRAPSVQLLSSRGPAKPVARLRYESGAQQPPKGPLCLVMVQHRAVDVVDEAEDPAEFDPVRIRIADTLKCERIEDVPGIGHTQRLAAHGSPVQQDRR